MILQRLARASKKADGRRGFTLVELAIVLGVASLLFGGLWRLMSTGSAQLRDQAAADQHKQVIQAVQSYLMGAEGVRRLRDNADGMNLPLDLPTAASAPCSPAGEFICFLPAGFRDTTVNSYGQTYQIFFRKDSGGLNNLAQSYSFMVVTQGGDTIPDSSGARLASMIGSDGGFLYAGAAGVCGGVAGMTACGAYGTWAVGIGNYGFAVGAANVGRVASRTNVGARVAQADSDWLARRQRNLPTIAGSGGLPDFNTMQTDLFLYTASGTADLLIGGNTIWGGHDRASPVVGGVIRGIQQLAVGTNLAPDPDRNFLFQGAAEFNFIANPSHSTLTIGGECETGGATMKPDCTPAMQFGLQVNGDANVTGQMNAAQFYAGLFLYQSDERLKKEIEAIRDPLDKLSKIRGVSFFFKDEGKDTRKHYGVVAQEVEKVFPELVVETHGNKAVDYPSFVGPLIAAVNELRERNDALKGQVEALTAKISVLENGAKEKSGEKSSGKAGAAGKAVKAK